MRLFSTTALSIAFAVSVGLAMPSGAIAAKKDEKAEQNAGPKLSPSKGFLPGADAVQKLIAANDFAGAKAKADEIAGTATKPDDQYYLGNFYLTIGLGLKDEALQRKGLEGMLATNLASPADAAKYHFYIGQFALNAKDYAGARTHLEAAANGGYNAQTSEVLVAESYFNDATTNQLQNNEFTPAGKQLIGQGLPHLKKAIELQKAAGQAVDPSWYNRGFKMAIFSKDPTTPEWTKLALANGNSAENWNFALRTLQETNKTMTRDENLDILRLMDSSKSLKSAYNYNEYAEAAWRVGLPGEVKAIIDKGKTAGDIKESDGNFAELYRLAAAAEVKDKASLASSEKSAAAAPTGKPAANTANAFLGYGENAKAAALYKVALQKGGVDVNEVNTRLGIALARSGDKAGALDAFSKVAAGGVRKQIADLWTVWLGGAAA